MSGRDRMRGLLAAMILAAATCPGCGGPGGGAGSAVPNNNTAGTPAGESPKTGKGADGTDRGMKPGTEAGADGAGSASPGAR